MSLRWWGPRLGLVVGGLALGLLLAEGVARMMAPAGHADLLFNSPDSSPLGLYVNDQELLLVPAAGFESDIQSLDYSVQLRINQNGLRGAEVSEKESHWLALGDSFTMAVQVSEEDSFAGRLSEAMGTTVLNAGVDGYSTWQATGRYQKLVSRGVAIDGVLLVFFVGNDFWDNDYFPEEGRRRAAQQESGSPIHRDAMPGWQAFLMKHSVLYAHYRVWQKAKALESGTDHDRGRWQQELSIFTQDGQQQLNHLSQKTLSALQELKRETQKNGDQLLVAIAPPAFVVDQSRMPPTFEVVGLDPTTARLTGPGDKAMNLLQTSGIAGCDLTSALQNASSNERPLYFQYDGHWTPAGHAVVTETILSCMGKQQ